MPNSIGLTLSQIWKGGRGLLHPATSPCPDMGERVFSFWKWKPVSWKHVSVSYLGNGNEFLGNSGDNASDDNMESDSDGDGGGKQISHSGM